MEKNQIKQFKRIIEDWPGYRKRLAPMERAGLFKSFLNGWQRRKNYDLLCWKQFISGFKHKYAESLEEIRKNAPQANIIKVLNLGYDELRHSRMLAWLLDYKASHMQGNLFFFHFLDVLGIEKTEEYQAQYYVQRERPDRIDISIYSPDNFTIFIENKIRADEREKQLDDEYKSLQKWSEEWRIQERNRYLVFLTPEGRTPFTLSEDTNDEYKKSLNIDYLKLSHAMSKAALSYECKSDYIRRVVIDYSKQISCEIKKYANI